MKDYILGIGIFVVLLVILANASVRQYRKTSAERAELESARVELQKSLNSQSIKNKQLVQQFGDDNVALFIAKNKDTLKSMMDLNSINQRLGVESEALRIPIQEQKTSASSVKGKPGTKLAIVPLNEYSISILSSFKDSLLWLGKIEDAFPYSRVESVKFSPSGEYVSLDTVILFPKVDPAVIAQ